MRIFIRLRGRVLLDVDVRFGTITLDFGSKPADETAPVVVGHGGARAEKAGPTQGYRHRPTGFV